MDPAEVVIHEVERQRVFVVLQFLNEAPNFVALQTLAFQVYENSVFVIRTGATQITEQFDDGIFRNAGHANCGADAVPLYQTGNHLRSFSGSQSVHGSNPIT